MEEVKIKQPKQQQATEIHSDKLSREWLQTYIDLLLSDKSLNEKMSSDIKWFSGMWHYSKKLLFFVFPFPLEFPFVYS